MRTRLTNFMARVTRFRGLRKVGVDTARLVRTGLRAITYSNAIMGVPCGLLRAHDKPQPRHLHRGLVREGKISIWRWLWRTAARKAALTLPAMHTRCPSSSGPWPSGKSGARSPMQKVVDDALQRAANATNKWAVVYGPGAAMVMTCSRLQWTIVSATKLIADLGELLDLVLDPPKVVVMQCFASVQRWRWERIESNLPQLAANGSGRGPIMEQGVGATEDQDQRGRMDRSPQRMPQVYHT